MLYVHGVGVALTKWSCLVLRPPPSLILAFIRVEVRKSNLRTEATTTSIVWTEADITYLPLASLTFAVCGFSSCFPPRGPWIHCTYLILHLQRAFRGSQALSTH